MKNIIGITLIVFTIFLVSFLPAKEKHLELKYFLLFDEDAVSINSYEEEKIIENARYPIKKRIPPYYIIGRDLFFQTDGISRTAIVDQRNRQYSIYDLNSDKVIKDTLSSYTRISATLLTETDFYISGITIIPALQRTTAPQARKIFFQRLSLETEEWTDINVPEPPAEYDSWVFSAYGFMLESLHIADDKLWGVDYYIFYKQILFFDLSDTGVNFSHTFELPHFYRGESYLCAIFSENYLGIVSTSQESRIGPYNAIRVYKKEDLNTSFLVMLPSTRFRRDPPPNEIRYIVNDYIIFNDRVIIACKVNGLGILSIKESFFETIPNYRSKRFYDNSIDISEINFHEFAEEEIVRLTIIPQTDKILLTIRTTEGQFRHEVFEVK